MSYLSQISREKVNRIDILLNKSKEELVKIILEKEKYAVPITILNSGLHPLQAVVKYLREKENLDIKTISILLNRDVQTIWTSYRLVKDKKFLFKKSQTELQIKIPLSILSKKNNSILESTINYLITIHHMRLTDIAKILGKSIKTIWTCNNRYITKGGKK